MSVQASKMTGRKGHDPCKCLLDRALDNRKNLGRPCLRKQRTHGHLN